MRLRGNLFWRTFGVLLTGLIVTVTIFTGIVVTTRQQGLQDNFETEVRMQAREVAEYMARLDRISSIRRNSTMQFILRQKISEIYNNYNADIWIVSYDAGTVQYLDRSWSTSEKIATDLVVHELGEIQAGNEIRVQGLFPELGDQIITIGVPWRYDDGYVVGAVMLHIPLESLHVGVTKVILQILPAALLSILIGICLSLLLTRSLTKPLQEINSAVLEFSKGDLSRRVNVNCGGEIETLGVNINKMAVELSSMEESRKMFVANVSHELRSPMTCMKGYVQAMLDGTIETSEMPKYLQIVMDETNRLTDLVRDLLDLSRLESGKFPMTLTAFDANELVRRTLINFEPRISEKNIEVEVSFADDPLYVMGDINRIMQVISNITDNAVKFMTGDNSVLKIGTSKEGHNVRFSIENNGPCISEEDLPHLFDRFYKADKAHTAGMGTGLGLSICQRIIQQHHSQIDVSSEPGATVFSFTLPLTEKSPESGK